MDFDGKTMDVMAQYGWKWSAPGVAARVNAGVVCISSKSLIQYDYPPFLFSLLLSTFDGS